MLKHVGMTRAEFVDFCIALGSDYNAPLEFTEAKRADEIAALIRHHGSIENINKKALLLDSQSNRRAVESLDQVRLIFNTLPNVAATSHKLSAQALAAHLREYDIELSELVAHVRAEASENK